MSRVAALSARVTVVSMHFPHLGVRQSFARLTRRRRMAMVTRNLHSRRMCCCLLSCLISGARRRRPYSKSWPRGARPIPAPGWRRLKQPSMPPSTASAPNCSKIWPSPVPGPLLPPCPLSSGRPAPPVGSRSRRGGSRPAICKPPAVRRWPCPAPMPPARAAAPGFAPLDEELALLPSRSARTPLPPWSGWGPLSHLRLRRRCRQTCSASR